MAKKKASYADSTYEKQIAYYNKLKADFAAQQTRQRGEVGAYYGTEATANKTKYLKDKKGKQLYDYKRLGFKYAWQKKKVNGKWKNVKYAKPTYQKTARKQVTKGKAATEGVYQKELRESRTRDTRDIQDDYAARGMIHSGLYAQKRGDYETEFGKQMTEQSRQKSKQYSQLGEENRSFGREQELQREQARLEAIRRRAAKTGQFL